MNARTARIPERDGGRTRERMIRGAAQLFRERGYAGAGFRELVETTGAPRGSIYHHFPGGKAELAREAVEYAAGVADQAIAAAIESGDAASAVESFVKVSCQMLEQSDYRAGCPVLAIATEAHDDDPDLPGVAARAFERWEARLAQALRRAGVPRTRADRLATVVVASVEGAIAISRARRDCVALEATGRELAELLRGAAA